jgi:hypothetical protein
MAHSRIIVKVKDCIAYIEGCGWKFIGRQCGAYWFKSVNGRKTMSGNNKIPFTLTELRHAYNNGW